MKRILILLCLQLLLFTSWAQSPSTGIPAAEMKEMIADLQKEIATLEADIKIAEKEDPVAVQSMKSQLATFKNLLASLEKTAGVKPKTPAAAKPPVAKAPVFSPVTRVKLAQPVTTPTAAQAKDKYFWYKGRKVNDSTLITRRGTLVQYSKKKDMLVVEPEKKQDSFNVVVNEIVKNEERKKELADKFDKTTNGFLFYPFLVGAIAKYDDLSIRYSEAVNNTIPFSSLPALTAYHDDGIQGSAVGHGPSLLNQESNSLNGIPDLKQLLQELERAKKLFDQLPPVSDFPAPPTKDLGMCVGCDTNILKKERIADSIWQERYQGKETEVVQIALSVGRVFQLLGMEDVDSDVNGTITDLFLKTLNRIRQKDQILLQKYGDRLEYFGTIMPVILGHERQTQLLGAGEEGSALDLGSVIGNMTKAYEKYYKEQAGLKNYDFVLNIPFHLGVERQAQLLGGGTEEGAYGIIERAMAFNRFAMTLEMDFDWERRSSDGELELRATGSVATPEKEYAMLIPNKCSFRMMKYGTDATNRSLKDITLALAVKSGVKTVLEDQGKLVNYPYSGPEKWDIMFPDCSINFCPGSAPDTVFLSVSTGDENAAAIGLSEGANTSKKYSMDMLVYIEYIFQNESTDHDEVTDIGEKMLNQVAKTLSIPEQGSTVEKLKAGYEGYMEMDELRKELQTSITTAKSKILIEANNRSTVLTDTYKDTKRKMGDEEELKKGLVHIRIVHEPMEK